MNELKKYSGGMPLTVEDLIFMQDAYKEAFAGILSYIDNCKLKGCVVTVIDLGSGNSQYDVTEGYIWLDKEVLYVPAHSVSGASSQPAFFAVNETLTRSKVFYNSTTKQVGAVRVANLFVSSTFPPIYMLYYRPDIFYYLRIKLGISGSTNYYTVTEFVGEVTGTVTRQQRSSVAIVFGVIRDASPNSDSELLLTNFGYNAPAVDITAPLINKGGGANGYVKMYAGSSILYYSRAYNQLGDHYFNFSYML